MAKFNKVKIRQVFDNPTTAYIFRLTAVLFAETLHHPDVRIPLVELAPGERLEMMIELETVKVETD